MSFEVELFCVGLAAVIDVVLLIVVLETGNRRLTAIWLKWALAGTALWHAGCFAHTALFETAGKAANRLDVVSMGVMVIGLLMLTSGLLHAALRIQRSGSDVFPRPDWRYALLYIPVLLSPVIVYQAGVTGERSFVAATRSWHAHYLVWLVAANGICVWLFLRNRNRLSRRTSGARFLLRFSLGLIAATVLTAFYILQVHQGQRDPAILRLLVTLSPVFPALIFAYYIFRRRLIPLVFERTLVYAACLSIVFLLHRLIVSPLFEQYQDQFAIDFVLLEGIFLVALILAYGPLRSRVNEGLRYLVGQGVARYRDRFRFMSVELAQRSDSSSEKLLQWFSDELRENLNLQFVEVRFIRPSSVSLRVTGSVAPDIDERGICPEEYDVTRKQLTSSLDGGASHLHFRDVKQLDLLKRLDLSAAYGRNDDIVAGAVLLGATNSGDRIPEEQVQATWLLIEQLCSVLQNQFLQQQKRAAERQAMHQEKLSVLGLLSGSIAHEVRNPLSSIRTIASLMKEDLGDDHEYSRDLDLIVSEADRLTQTTSQLLDFAKPEQGQGESCNVVSVVENISQVLGHLARTHGVKFEIHSRRGKLECRASQAVATDVLLNLIKNAIEACRESEQKCVRVQMSRVAEREQLQIVGPSVACDQADSILIVISDTGPGVPVELKAGMFQPFVTGKDDGTGLGLYLVAERLREVGGQIECVDGDVGAEFHIVLPTASPIDDER